jgi:hypothetical protein
MVQTPVTDGSFEDVDSSAIGVSDATSGGWTLSGIDAYFESNTNNAYQTPYGSIFVTLYGEGYINSVSQPVALAPCRSGTYTLSYSYEIAFEDDSSGNPCILMVTYGGVTIDSVDISASTGEWITRTQVFTPAAGSGTLSFIWDCSALLGVDEINLLLDNISIS